MNITVGSLNWAVLSLKYCWNGPSSRQTVELAELVCQLAAPGTDIGTELAASNFSIVGPLSENKGQNCTIRGTTACHGVEPLKVQVSDR